MPILACFVSGSRGTLTFDHVLYANPELSSLALAGARRTSVSVERHKNVRSKHVCNCKCKKSIGYGVVV